MNLNWSYSPEESPYLGEIRWLFEPCDLEIWRMTLKNNRAPLLSNIKLCASFHHYMWIQTGVKVRKRLSWVLTSVTLTFDLWPWPLAWTSLLSLLITPENFMMIRWWEHSKKGVTDRQTDRQTDWTIHRAAWSQLKMVHLAKVQHHTIKEHDVYTLRENVVRWLPITEMYRIRILYSRLQSVLLDIQCYIMQS